MSSISQSAKKLETSTTLSNLSLTSYPERPISTMNASLEIRWGSLLERTNKLYSFIYTGLFNNGQVSKGTIQKDSSKNSRIV